MQLALLDTDNPQFPDPRTAIREPDGLLAVGGNLSPSTLVSAYSQGIFPWYQDDAPILWWSPSERCLLAPVDLHISKSLRKCLKKQQYQITTDRDFGAVIRACANTRATEGTWISDEMISAFQQLHEQGIAHSVEVWDQHRLVGGIYGVAMGTVFSGESMFSAVTNGSKIAMAYLCRWLDSSGFNLLDCQIENNHLLSLGAQVVHREWFLTQLETTRSTRLAWPQAAGIDWSGD